MAYDELELDRIGDRKTAVFFIISDTTQTYNFLVALAFSQIQGRRIDAHIILGKSIKEIAEAEGVHEESVRQSIKRGLERMKKTF